MAGQSSVHHAPASRIYITAHCSAKCLIFLLFLFLPFASYLNTSQLSIPPLALNSLIPSIFSPLSQTIC